MYIYLYISISIYISLYIYTSKDCRNTLSVCLSVTCNKIIIIYTSGTYFISNRMFTGIGLSTGISGPRLGLRRCLRSGQVCVPLGQAWLASPPSPGLLDRSERKTCHDNYTLNWRLMLPRSPDHGNVALHTLRYTVLQQD